MKIFAVINQKGGTGKTTLSLNLSAQLAASGRRVLLVDIDPQGNATSASGANKRALQKGLYEALRGDILAQDALLCCVAARHHLIGANSRLAGAEMELPQMDNWQTALKRALQPLNKNFDFVFVDCPPSLSVLTVNALVAAQWALIPMQCEYFALEGLSDLSETLRHLRRAWNPQIKIAGIVRSMHDSRNTLARDVSRELDSHFGNKVFAASIPRNVRLAEAPSHRLPINQYAPASSGAAGYAALGREFMQRFAQ